MRGVFPGDTPRDKSVWSRAEGEAAMPKVPGKGKPPPPVPEAVEAEAEEPEEEGEAEAVEDFEGYFPPVERQDDDDGGGGALRPRVWSPVGIAWVPAAASDAQFERRTETIVENERAAKRTYQVSQLAAQLSNASAPTALVICLHGYLQTSAWACANLCEPWAAEYGYLSVCPQGYAVGGGAGTVGWGWNANESAVAKSRTACL